MGYQKIQPKAVVALRKESVDRNLSARAFAKQNHVALRKESVDRNSGKAVGAHAPARRSPQGERG